MVTLGLLEKSNLTQFWNVSPTTQTQNPGPKTLTKLSIFEIPHFSIRSYILNIQADPTGAVAVREFEKREKVLPFVSEDADSALRVARDNQPLVNLPLRVFAANRQHGIRRHGYDFQDFVLVIK